MWTDEDIDAFIRTRYPDFYPMFKGYDVHIKRVDTVRYLILKEFGGIYADMDYECRRRFYERLPRDKVSIAESKYKVNEEYQNALMASPKGHPFWDVVMEIVQERYERDGCSEGQKKNVLHCTGPNVIDAAVADPRTRKWFHRLPVRNYMDEDTARYAAHLGTAVWFHDGNLPKMDSSVPKVIWTYWHDANKMPRVVQDCIASWWHYCPDHEVRILVPKDVERLVPEAKSIMHRLRAQKRSEARISDYVRLAILKRYGGIWMDASCLMTQSLDWIHKKSPGKDLVAFYHWSTRPGHKHPIVESFFLAAPKGSKFISDWHDEFVRSQMQYASDEKYIENVSAKTDIQDLGQKLPYLLVYLCAAVVQQRTGSTYDLDLTDAMGPQGPYKYMKKHDWDIEKSVEELRKNPNVRTPMIKFHNGVRDYMEEKRIAIRK
jgi:mannosyltransferase OCH1-like enzyme